MRLRSNNYKFRISSNKSRPPLNDAALFRMNGIQIIAIKISPLLSKSSVIICVYRPPSSSSSWLDSFFAVISKFCSLYPTITITGDFNIDLLKSSTFSDGLSSDFGFQKYIRRPTRVTNDSTTLIDHIYSCNVDITYANACNLNLADHFAAIFCMSCSSTEAGIWFPHRLRTYRSFKSFDAEVLKHDLQSYPWNVLNNYIQH